MVETGEEKEEERARRVPCPRMGRDSEGFCSGLLNPSAPDLSKSKMKKEITFFHLGVSIVQIP